ncbi:hypothetical protein N7523_010980 [Penicillium sp. IBT 18751x]|nr:hypothetical protein N7523_010980 [Penicillium sp. IBT 18751x]
MCAKASDAKTQARRSHAKKLGHEDLDRTEFLAAGIYHSNPRLVPGHVLGGGLRGTFLLGDGNLGGEFQ